MRHPFALAAVAAAAALLVAGCGSSGTSSTKAAAAAATQTAATATGASSPATPSGAVLVSTKQGKYGTILAGGSKRLTVYLFEADKGSTPSCTGACAKAWPPVTTSGAPKAAGGAVAADLGTSTRPDGTTQVTYKGHPLYYYARDADSGDAYGQDLKEFGADWYVLAPSGNKVEGGGSSSSNSSGSTSSNSDGSSSSNGSGGSSGNGNEGSSNMGAGSY